MTLDTRVYVLGEIDPGEVFRFCQSLLTEYDQDKRTPDRQKVDPDRKGIFGDGTRTICNSVGQNLPAWLMVHYRDGGAYRTPEHAAVHEYCNHPEADCYTARLPICDKTEHDPACWLEVSFDTTYSYRGPDRMGCGDLHARLVASLGKWLDERGVGWKWLNEFRGEVHEGYERLIDLCSGGFAAQAWFDTVAAPAIAAHIAEETS